MCYTTDNIVTCSDSNSTIRNGYWFGAINERPTVTICLINYCNFDNCEATTGTCDLYPLRDNLCIIIILFNSINFTFTSKSYI